MTAKSGGEVCGDVHGRRIFVLKLHTGVLKCAFTLGRATVACVTEVTPQTIPPARRGNYVPPLRCYPDPRLRDLRSCCLHLPDCSYVGCVCRNGRKRDLLINSAIPGLFSRAASCNSRPVLHHPPTSASDRISAIAPAISVTFCDETQAELLERLRLLSTDANACSAFIAS